MRLPSRRRQIFEQRVHAMEYLIGSTLALAICAPAAALGLDRDRAFYPVVLIAIASYYSLFAAMAGTAPETIRALWLDGTIALLFAAIAVIGFKRNLWLVVVALAAHGALDFVHHHLIANPGVPLWWPGFCAMFDWVAAACLGLSLILRSKTRRAPG